MILAKPFIALLKGFLQDTISRTICCLSLFILVGCYFVFFQNPSLSFYPDKKNVTVFYYNDSINKGNSIIIDSLRKVSEGCLSYVLKEGFISPYVGIGFEHKLFRKFTISHFNKVRIQISGEGVKSILVYLVFKDEKADIQGSKDGILCSYLDIENKEKTIDLRINHFKTRTKNQIKSVTINYQAINIEKKLKDDRSFLDYISEHFNDSELSLSLISKQTGIRQRHIAESILAQCHCNVKTYINQIRVNEAQRLMRDTELKISEIAYKVGFSSPSNFNRVFKRTTNQTPSDFYQKS